MDSTSVGHSWNDVRKELFTAEEIAECDLQVALISELIKARHEKGLSQKEATKKKIYESTGKIKQ